ncbi:hypothetical protein BC628DRAFT_1321311 [Trametes gibbosa]|nr:hypothetical protein BC628DRAFT_1321311 [Trametes gibbosa]
MSDTFGIPTLLADFDQEDALRVQQELYAQRFRDQQEVSQAIDGICRSAWYDFYAREPVQCGQLLGSLEVASPQPPLPSDDLLETTNMDKVEGDVSLGADVFQRWSGDLQATSILSINVELSLPPLRSYAYPKYESCAPSIEIARYVDDSRILRFVPYADEPAFEAQAYCSAHIQIGWQSEWFDVDFKLIVADALLRLEAAEINRDKIDQLKPRFLPYPGGDLMTSLGKRHVYRDILGWGSGALQTFHATLGSVVGSPPLLSEINSLVAHFCSSLNCNKAKCMLHEYISEKFYVFEDHEGGKKLIEAQEMVHKFRGLNYAFGLEDNSHCLDAATLGNTLRYINDPKGVQKVNVTASAKNVAGELKILFFTSKDSYMHARSLC